MAACTEELEAAINNVTWRRRREMVKVIVRKERAYAREQKKNEKNDLGERRRKSI